MKIRTLKLIAPVVALMALVGCDQTKNNTDVAQSSSGKALPEVRFYSVSQQDSILKVAVGDTSAIQNYGAPELLDKGEGDESYYLIKRTVKGHVEMHEQWDDVVIIRSGHGLLRTGREIKGAKPDGEEPFKNLLGGEIIGFKERKISPGDFIVIPAKTGHQYIPDKNDTLTYWTIKIKRTK